MVSHMLLGGHCSFQDFIEVHSLCALPNLFTLLLIFILSHTSQMLFSLFPLQPPLVWLLSFLQAEFMLLLHSHYLPHIPSFKSPVFPTQDLFISHLWSRVLLLRKQQILTNTTVVTQKNISKYLKYNQKLKCPIYIAFPWGSSSTLLSVQFKQSLSSFFVSGDHLFTVGCRLLPH